MDVSDIRGEGQETSWRRTISAREFVQLFGLGSQESPPEEGFLSGNDIPHPLRFLSGGQQIDNEFNHHIFMLGIAFRHEKGQSDKSIVINIPLPIRI